ncbi:nitrate- and nitrite sensing domain-containing protein [Alcaligenaceae bacterium]|nr:nitrate- and nitrite sensing domain-containing protein [Alcaligenaceae bacterium]
MHGFIANLRMWQKFALIGVLVMGILAIPTTLVVKLNLDSVRSAHAEEAGLGPAGGVLKLIQLTQQHRGLSAGFLAGNTSLGPARLSRQGEIEQAIGSVAGALSANLNDPSLMASLDKIKNNWRELGTAISGKAMGGPESFQRHTALVTEQLNLLENIVDTSGLALDPDAASFHLINAVLGELPQLTEYLGQTRAVGSVLLAKQVATPDDKVQINVLVSLAQHNLQGARSAFNKAGTADAALQASIAKPLAAALAAAEAGLALPNEKIARAQQLEFSSDDYFSGMTRAIDAQFDLITVAFNALEHMLAQRVDDRQQTLWVISGVMAAIFILALSLVMLVIKSIVQSIAQSLHIAQTVARGDLTSVIEARGTDETGQLLQALDNMNSSLTDIVIQVRSGTDSIAIASSQIAAGNTDLSARTVAQASSLEETAASMEQLTSTVTQNADNARLANSLAQSASEVAIKGGQVVKQVADTMASINDSSRKIVDIIGIIDGIAFQTNILALNAAVEAARAGEQGRGFAVVAAEVRSLAQRSAASAQEIKHLIDASVSQVDDGSQLASAAGQTMEEIVSSIRRVTDIMGEISVASQEQTLGIEQINQAVSQMDGVTQQNAALVEEAAAAAHSLQEQADSLVAAVSVFKVTDVYAPAVSGGKLLRLGATNGILAGASA